MAVAKTTIADPPKTPKECSNSITRVAVAQIVQSVGYRRSKPSALQVLTSVSILYIRSLAAAASAHATQCGRTQCNLFDIVLALEELASPLGFRGGSSVQASILSSSILEDISKFMRLRKRLPFAKPFPRQSQTLSGLGTGDVNSVPVGDQRRRPEIPQWLPDFPDMGTEWEPNTEREELYGEKKGDHGEGMEERKEVVDDKLKNYDKRKRMLLMSRERVKFRIGVGKKKRKVDSNCTRG